jgi:hypothetical protein
VVLIHGQYPVDAVDSIVAAFEQDKEAIRIAKVAAKKVDPLASKMATPVRTGAVRSRQATPTRVDMLPPQPPRIVSRSPSPHMPKVGVKMRDVKVRARVCTHAPSNAQATSLTHLPSTAGAHPLPQQPGGSVRSVAACLPPRPALTPASSARRLHTAVKVEPRTTPTGAARHPQQLVRQSPMRNIVNELAGECEESAIATTVHTGTPSLAIPAVVVHSNPPADARESVPSYNAFKVPATRV